MRTLIFGGTTEGRRLAELLSVSGVNVTLCVATEYGKKAVSDNGLLEVIAKRLSQAEISVILYESEYDYVIDATHPYAEAVTLNIKNACIETGAKYIRLIRDCVKEGQGVLYVENAAEAAEALKNTDGNILLTIGSKELEPFTEIDGYAERLFVRIIPMQDSLEKAIRLGFDNAKIICMQGPFDVDMNAATLKMVNAAYMVTKDSGETGGFLQKLEAAETVGCKVIVVARPVIEAGHSFDEVLSLFGVKTEKSAEEFTFFPLFTDLCGRKITVIGGGKVAERRIRALAMCKADITVVSPKIADAIKESVQTGKARHICRTYENGDTLGAFLVIAATNNREVNRTVMNDAREAGSLVIVSDSMEDCDCYFPAIAENNEFLAGIVSKRGNHAGVSKKARELRRFLNYE